MTYGTKVRKRSGSISSRLAPFCVPAVLSNIPGMSRVIEIRPFRGGWQCFEAKGVAPYRIGEQAKQDAIGYGKVRRVRDSGSK